MLFAGVRNDVSVIIENEADLLDVERALGIKRDI